MTTPDACIVLSNQERLNIGVKREIDEFKISLWYLIMPENKEAQQRMDPKAQTATTSGSHLAT